MTRLVKHSATGPTEVRTKSGDQVWVCRCGLTRDDKGLCDGSHQKTAGEDNDNLYQYGAKLDRSQVTINPAS